MKTLIPILLIFAAYASFNAAYGQDCEPAELSYIVRDDKGRNLSEAKLQTIFDQMPPPSIVAANTLTKSVGRVRLTKAGKLAGYSTKVTRPGPAVISYAEAGLCRIQISGLTLKYAGRTMRLIFDLDIEHRAYVIDSLPFQNGTFKLDQNGLSKGYYDRIVPAARWKRVKNTP